MDRPSCDPGYLRRLVSQWRPEGQVEARTHQRFLRELDRLSDPCNRYADLVHVTASAIVAGPRGTVLVHHKRLHRWVQPGGHIDPGEAPPEAARREAAEETGLPVEHPGPGPLLLQLDVHPAADDHVHLDMRYLLLTSVSTDPLPGPGESRLVRWYGWDHARSTVDVVLVDGLRRAQQALDDGVHDRKERGK